MDHYFGRHLTADWELTRYNTNRDLVLDNTWPDNKIAWCHDPHIDEGSFNSFLLAIKEFENALSGCLKFNRTIDNNGRCANYPEKGGIYVTSAEEGCYSTGISSSVESRRKFPQKLILNPEC